jgi:hypothetical protein
MAETPKTREDLWFALGSECGLVAEDVLDAIEALGLRIVPADATKEMLYAVDHGLGVAKKMWADALSKNPFAPEIKP